MNKKFAFVLSLCIASYALSMQQTPPLSPDQQLFIDTLMGDEEGITTAITNKANVNATDVCGQTPVFKACANGNTKILALLAKNGASLTKKDRSGNAPIHEACRYNQVEVVRYLLDNGEKVTTPMDDPLGLLPLHVACFWGSTDVARLLIKEYKANLEVKTIQGKTPLFYACGGDHLELADYLLKRYADINTRDANNETPAHYTFQSGTFEACEFLIHQGANMQALNDVGQTPLQKLGSSPYVDRLRKLAEKQVKKAPKRPNSACE
jgi:ankyrin repeat protein